MATDTYDIAIVGGGPAGLSAAIWSARYLHSVVLVDSAAPRNWETRRINGYLGLPGIRPPQMRELGRREARDLGVSLLDGGVLRVERDSSHDAFSVALEGGERVVGRRLLLAFGIRDVWPDIPGLAEVYGANAHVCPDCDGLDARGKKVVVVGMGRRAVGMALNLLTWTSDIIICTNGRPAGIDDDLCARLDALNIPMLTDRILGVQCERRADSRSIRCLRLENGMELDAEKIFFTLAQYPADDLGVQLGCERDESGRIVVDGHQHTSAHNVFAAGDITPGPQLAIVAAAEGAVAALSMHRSLVPAELKL